MISILIPTYNYSINLLVHTLHEQCVACAITFEILCYDDNSDDNYQKSNASIETLTNVSYFILTRNIGRSAIRNLLSKRAKYEYLLFIDADSAIISPNFIKNYLVRLKKNIVICGGVAYDENFPTNNKHHYLHWYYGKNRESKSATIRKKHPYDAFKTFNFLIDCDIFFRIQFDEKIQQYGHEDTVFGFELKQIQANVVHIDNPLLHTGLQESVIFLEKTRKAVENLKKIKKDYPLLESTLLKGVHFAQRYKIDNLCEWIYQKNKNRIVYYLQNTYPPSLFLLDFYKLGYFLSLKENK